jgi:hypothetical protein
MRGSKNEIKDILAEVLAGVSSLTGQPQIAGKRKFQKDWCKELTQLTFNHSRIIQNCDGMSVSQYCRSNSKIITNLFFI